MGIKHLEHMGYMMMAEDLKIKYWVETPENSGKVHGKFHRSFKKA